MLQQSCLRGQPARRTRIPRPRMPVEAYLSTQARYAHLFAPERNNDVIAEIQARVDAYWAGAG
jgi:pyruvate ferredoxin oxidoreductase beta subunit